MSNDRDHTPDWLNARQRLITVTDNAHSYCDLAPGVGQAWKLIYVVGSHNDGAAARASSFYYTDNIASTSVELHAAQTIATGVLMQLYNYCYCQGPLILRYGQFLRLYIPAAAGGTTLTVEAFVEEIIGEDSYGE